MSKLTKALTAAAGNAGESLYVEDVFSTYLYTGTAATQTITNGIDLSGEGGLVWIKSRSFVMVPYAFDTERGTKSLATSTTDGENSGVNFTATGLTYNSDGVTIPTALSSSSQTYASWTFRKAEKFFDVVTYTGNGSATNNVSHNLGDVPGFIVVKRTDGDGNWCVAAGDSSGNYKQLTLNNTGQSYVSTAKSNIADSSIFNAGYIGTNFDGSANASGGSYVAYLFAHDAGGFGNGGSESIIKCGSYTGNGGSQEINLGFEPQWLMIKKSSSTGSWQIIDTMRGMPVDAGSTKYLLADSSIAEYGGGAEYQAQPTATGFKLGLSNDVNQSGVSFIYIAIRRPMKTPESGTEVFAMDTGTTSTPNWISGFVTDFVWYKYASGVYSNYWQSRLTGTQWLTTDSTNAQNSSAQAVWDFMDGFGAWSTVNNVESWMFKRATGFFDVVAYTGDGTSSGYTVNHNLGVTPELLVIKSRSATTSWRVQTSHYFNSTPFDRNAQFNTTNAMSGGPVVENVTSTGFEPISVTDTNGSGFTYIAYLFATLAGVSKVGSYTGTAADLNVDCGFSAGARFILIKRTDSTGDWYVWDSLRGIVAGNDPYLLLNSTAAQVTNTDYIDPLASGFTVTSNASGTVNVSGGNYIFLAIA